MAEGSENLGLKVLYEGQNPQVDIVAVHGLGANPDWAWTRKVKDGEEIFQVNWLKDKEMLPSKIPDSRIMTFNYGSRWHVRAPKQRCSLCAIQLLTALDNDRKEVNPRFRWNLRSTSTKAWQEKHTQNRPLIFIGHSFGGVVIEESLVNATVGHDSFAYLASLVVGVVFLGVPHRGSAAAAWGTMITKAGKVLGLGSEDSIMKELQENSEGAIDLLYSFTLWANRSSVTLICFFEQYETDYDKRLGFSWKEMIVNETSACLDGRRKVPLPTDHIHINKYSGPDDYSYKTVYPFIVQMTQNAAQVVDARLHPRPIVKNDSRISHDNRDCLRALYLTEPQDDLTALRSAKGDCIEGTCEWVLSQEPYTSWLNKNAPRLLWINGSPGIGKTMISSFLVEEMKHLAKHSSSKTFAYYFCDYKHEDRRTGTAILRGLLLQIVRQKPGLFKHIRPDYDMMGDKLFSEFHALWRIFKSMTQDQEAGYIYCLIDALDECEAASRGLLLTALTKLFDLQGKGQSLFKMIITSRRQNDIMEELLATEVSTIHDLRVDSGKVNIDLSKFINVKVAILSRKKKYMPELKEEIQRTLEDKAEGTFLYVSMVLDDLAKANPFQVKQKLKDLPSNLYDAYDRILRHIDPECVEIVRLVFQWVAVAKEPLSIRQLATAIALNSGEWEGTLESAEILALRFEDAYRCCEPLVYNRNNHQSTRWKDYNTIEFVHQSAKDYLMGEHLQNNHNLSHYHVSKGVTNAQVLKKCWIFLSLGGLAWDEHRSITPTIPQNTFLSYASDSWLYHALAASPSLAINFQLERDDLDKLPRMRALWLCAAASKGQEIVVERLLTNGAKPDGKSFQRIPLHCAALYGHVTIVKSMLEKGANIEAKDSLKQTALHLAAENGHIAVAELLLKKGANIEVKDSLKQTMLHVAAENGDIAVAELLLKRGANIEVKDFLKRTALHLAAKNGDIAVVELLLEKGANIEAKNFRKHTALHTAAENGHIAVVEMLLEKGADPGAANGAGCTPLSIAMKQGHKDLVRYLGGHAS